MDQSRDAAANDQPLVFELYHENSKQRRHDFEFNRRINVVNNNVELHRVIARTFKSYPGSPYTPLPVVEPADGPAFERVAAERRSIRRFSGAPSSLDQLARLLFFGNGLTGRLDATSHGIVQPVRAAPSGGALFPIEIYVAVTAVDGLEAGIYHYAVDRHGLELRHTGDVVTTLSAATSDPATCARAAVTIILAGVFGRGHFKYGERAYRFALLEAGHICQNVLLTATALGLGAVPIGGFVDDEVNALLDVDGVDEAVVYMAAVGQPAPRDRTALVDQVLGTLWSRHLDGANHDDH
jgi:SagB-type dehydrogenase family enzyme